MVESYYSHTFECKATSLAKTTCATPSLFTTPEALELADAALTNTAKMENLSQSLSFDRGKEVLLLADSHFSFYRKHKQAEGATQEQMNALRLRDCYMFGTSTANRKRSIGAFRRLKPVPR
jgi:hypothetical protein